MTQRRTRKKMRTRNVLKKVRARKRTRKRWGLEGALKREVGLGNALSWMVKGPKAHLKRKWGLEAYLKKWGLEGALKREVGLGNALPWMVKGSKAHLKRKTMGQRCTRKKVRTWNVLKKMRARRRTRKRWGLECALERGEGSKAHSKER